jgi:hypothetical protein
MFELGGELFKVAAIVRSQQARETQGRLKITFRLPETESLPSKNVY